MCCDLEIDVNGQETFLVNKKIIVSHSGRLRKLFRKSKDNAGRLKVIFINFPGGSEGFELFLRFCYNGGRLNNINVSSSDVTLLLSAAIFLEIDEDGLSLSSSGLIREMSWSELLECLKQSQDLLHFISNSVVLQDLMESLVEKISTISAVSPNGSCSTDNFSCMQFSGDISSEVSREITSNSSWFDDLEFLRIDLVEKLVRTMIASKKVDDYTVSCFLFRYQKMKKAEGAEKQKIAETIIDLLDLLEDRSHICVRCLFDNLQVSMALRLQKSHKRKVESLIGSVLDRAKLNDLIFPSPYGKRCAYDVDLVLRIQKQFLLQFESRKMFPMHRLKKVALLMDSYIAEVAPDHCLKPAKFIALAVALPADARVSHDRIYHALDMYLKVHDKICDEEKMKVCGFLDCNKLSIGFLMDLRDNTSFPASARMSASFSLFQNSKLGKFPGKMGCVWSIEDDDSKSRQISAKSLEKLDYQTIDHMFT